MRHTMRCLYLALHHPEQDNPSIIYNTRASTYYTSGHHVPTEDYAYYLREETPYDGYGVSVSELIYDA